MQEAFKIAFLLIASGPINAYILVMSQHTAPIQQAADGSPDREMAILTEIGRILSSTLDLRDAFPKMMQLISDQLYMHRGTLVLLDESTGELRTQAALGLSADDIE